MGIYSDILITCDYDRTLTAPDTTIPAANLEAIRYFMAGGGAFTLNTGRSVPMCRLLLDRIPMNAPLILYNGSAAYDPATGELSQLRPIDLDMWPTLLDVAKRYPDLLVEIQCTDAHCLFREDAAWAQMLDTNSCTHRFVKPGDDLGPFIKFALYGQIRGSNVDNLFEANAEDLRYMDMVYADLRERYGTSTQIFRAAPRIIDVHAKGVNKGRGALELKRRLGRKI